MACGFKANVLGDQWDVIVHMHEILISFFQSQSDYISFFYGMSFVILGILCLLMTDPLKYRLQWRPLGIFALLVGIVQWVDYATITLGDAPVIHNIQFFVLLLSVLFLVEFARRNTSAIWKNRLFVGIYGVAAVAMIAGWFSGGRTIAEVFGRYILVLGGGFWSAWIVYGHAGSAGKKVLYLRSIAIVLGVHMLIAGLVVSPAGFFPANILNYDTFLNFFGFPVMLLKGIFALLLSFLVCSHYFECMFRDYQTKLRYYFQKYFMYGVIVVLLFGGWFLVDKTSRDVLERFKTSLFIRTESVAASLDPVKVKVLSGEPSDIEKPEFQLLKERFVAIHRASQDCRFVYLMGVKDGKAVFLLDAEPSSSPDYSPPGQVYEEIYPRLMDALLHGQAYVFGPQKDRWGEWLSAFAPVNDVEGHFIALLGMDIGTASLHAQILRERLVPIGIVMLVMMFVLVLFYIIVNLQERALKIKDSEERLNLVLAGSRDAAWEADLKDGRLKVSDRFLEIGSIPSGPHELSLQIWQDRTHPEDWPEVMEKYGKFLRGETEFLESEHRVNTFAGEVKWVLIRGKVIRRDSKGVPLATAGTLTDITERKRIEEATRKAEQRFRDIVYSSGDLVWEVDLQGRFTYASQNIEPLLGYREDEILGKTPFDIMTLEEATRVSAIFSDVAGRKGSIKDLDNMYLAKDGHAVYLLTNGVPILDTKGELAGYRGVCKDITQRKRTEDELKFKNLLFSTQQELSIDGMLIVDQEMKISSYNQRFLDMWQIPAVVVKTNRDENLLREVVARVGDPDAFLVRVRHLYEHPRETSRDEIVLKDGRVFDRYSTAMFLADGVYRGRIWYFRDITDSKRAEMELRLARQKLSDIIEFLPDSTFVIDENKKVIAWNKAMEEMTGICKNDVLGKGDRVYSMPFYGDTRPILIDLVLEPDVVIAEHYPFLERRGNSIFAEAFTPRINQGKGIYCWGVATKLFDNNGKLIGAIESIRDVTARKQVEEMLRESKEKAEAADLAKSEFLANMSHEIRTPMNAVLGFTEVLKSTEISSQQMMYLDSISASGEQLLGVINDILDISKIESGHLTLESIDFNLGYLIEDVIKMMRGRMRGKSIQFLYNMPLDIPVDLEGDPTKIRQVLVNLLGNAIKFTQVGSVLLDIGMEKETADHVVLRCCVHDTGIGIPPEKLGVIFEKFVQADMSTTRQFGGTGLGLAITKSIVQAMGGRIWVESDPGKGSRFYFTLVLKKKLGIVSREIQPLLMKDFAGRRILIVDDSKIGVEILRKICLKWQVETAEAFSGPEALGWLMQRIDQKLPLPEVILVDIMMPFMDGKQLITTIKSIEVCKKIKFVAVSSDAYVGASAAYHQAGFDAFLPKPIIVRELLSVLTTVMGDQRSGGQIVTRHMAEELACKGVSLLIVEDVVANQDVMRAYCQILGCVADFAENGLVAVELIKNDPGKYAMCFMDIQMPVMNGYEAAKVIREQVSQELPIIALTAGALAEDKDNCFEAGMNDYLAKPVTRAAFRDMIVKYIRRQMPS